MGDNDRGVLTPEMMQELISKVETMKYGEAVEFVQRETGFPTSTCTLFVSHIHQDALEKMLKRVTIKSNQDSPKI